MITPKFICTQTDTSVIVHIHVPAVRASDVEIHVDDTLVSIHITPYFLRLTLPGSVVEDDNSSAVYDPSTGDLTVTLTKASIGENFKDLDILAKLLAPQRGEAVPTPVIEVIGSNDNQSPLDQRRDGELVRAAESLSLKDEDEQDVLDAAQNDWLIRQKLPVETAEIDISPNRYYGFLNLYSGYFSHVGHTENDVNELGSDAEALSITERKARRAQHEGEKWDEEHYMADFAEDECIQEILAYKFPRDAPCATDVQEPLIFTEEENLAMLRLPQKEYLASREQEHDLFLTLMTILFAYTYDARTTQYEPTPESAWTICSLTPAISALDPPPYGGRTNAPMNFTSEELQASFVPSFRRSLAFPLYRSFALSGACVADVSALLSRGKRAVLRALLETKNILDKHEVYYIYSKIWIDDFCVWVAKHASDDVLSELGRQLKLFRMDKGRLGWDLQALEDSVRRQLNRDTDSDDESEDDDDN